MIALDDVKLGPNVMATLRWDGFRNRWSASYAEGKHDDPNYRDGHHTGIPGETAQECLRNAMQSALLTESTTRPTSLGLDQCLTK